jgi:hypothetical protein
MYVCEFFKPSGIQPFTFIVPSLTGSFCASATSKRARSSSIAEWTYATKSFERSIRHHRSRRAGGKYCCCQSARAAPDLKPGGVSRGREPCDEHRSDPSPPTTHVMLTILSRAPCIEFGGRAHPSPRRDGNVAYRAPTNSWPACSRQEYKAVTRR